MTFLPVNITAKLILNGIESDTRGLLLQRWGRKLILNGIESLQSPQQVIIIDPMS